MSPGQLLTPEEPPPLPRTCMAARLARRGRGTHRTTAPMRAFHTGGSVPLGPPPADVCRCLRMSSAIERPPPSGGPLHDATSPRVIGKMMTAVRIAPMPSEETKCAGAAPERGAGRGASKERGEGEREGGGARPRRSTRRPPQPGRSPRWQRAPGGWGRRPRPSFGGERFAPPPSRFA